MNFSIGLVIPEKTPPLPFSTSFEAVAKNSSPIPSSSSGTSSRFFVTCRSTSPGERTRSGAFSEGGATNEAVGTAGCRYGTEPGTGDAGEGIPCGGTDEAGDGTAQGAGAAGVAATGTPCVTVAGGAAWRGAAGPGDFPAFVPSGTTAAAPDPAGGIPFAVPPKDGIGRNSRRKPVATRAFLTT